MIYAKNTLFISFLLLSVSCLGQLPKGFVYAHTLVPGLKIELKYCGDANFLGRPVNGYHNDVVIVTEQTAKALQKVQALLKQKGLGIKVYDAYRPQRAVDDFILWAKALHDTIKKQQFYPDVDKTNLFKEGYIAARSGHSKGSTVDITLVYLDTGKELDMGTPFDFFGRQSWVDYDSLTEKQKANRRLLQDIMLNNGFVNYQQEWWHFTLKNQPFKSTYFDFPVE